MTLKTNHKLIALIASIVFVIAAVVVSLLALPTLRGFFTPDIIQLPVPFTSQAPAGNWEEPWQNACEETAIVMITDFYAKASLTEAKAITEISNILSIKEQNFGTSKNESLERMVAIVNAAKLKWQAHVVTDPTLKAMQAELAAGRPLIVPVDARQLTNPYFAHAILEYHVIVVSGYDNKTKKFIAQDPGTDKGANFMYGYDELMTAMHDYVEPDIRQGRKAVLFTAPAN